MDEIFYKIEKREYENIKSDFIFIMQEDKNLSSASDKELMELEIDIVPNFKRKRMRYNFEDFEDLYEYLKKENKSVKIFPYAGEDLV